MARHINISSEYSSAKQLPAKPFKDIDFRSYQFTIVVIRRFGLPFGNLHGVANQCISRGCQHLF